MGRRIDAFIEIVQFLRMTDPKYSFEIELFQCCMSIASIVLIIMNEYKLFALVATVLWISLGIQTLRIRRVVIRKQRELEEFVMQSCSAYLQEDLTDEKNKNREQHTAETDCLIALMKEDIEQARREKRVEG